MLYILLDVSLVSNLTKIMQEFLNRYTYCKTNNLHVHTTVGACENNSLCITISSSSIVERGPTEVVQTGQRGTISYQGEDTLILGSGCSVMEGAATILVTSIDVRKTNHVQNDINTLNVTGGRER